MSDATPNPEEDLKHAHALLSRMTPEELLRATYALEAIVEQSPWFQEKMRRSNQEASQGPCYSMEQVLDDLGFDRNDFPGLVPPSKNRDEAA